MEAVLKNAIIESVKQHGGSTARLWAKANGMVIVQVGQEDPKNVAAIEAAVLRRVANSVMSLEGQTTHRIHQNTLREEADRIERAAAHIAS